MTFLAPGYFLASLAVAAAVAVLHFIVTRQPRAGVLPTARFVPDLPATATARATRPSDLLLMLLRVLLVLAAGAGLSRPVVKPTRGADARVILVDISRSVKNPAALRDSVRAVYRHRDALIVFDSAAHMLGGSIEDSVGSITPGRRKANISAALITALRAGSAMREVADSLELVVVSPFAAEGVDAATSSIRTLWPGRARLVRIGSAAADASAGNETLSIRSGANDPLAVTARLAEARANAVIVRNGSASVDALARDAAVVEWPMTARPRGSVARARNDTVGGVLSGNSLVVASFERRWSYPADSVRRAVVIARWIDGEPAALEWKSGEGCARSVSVPVTPVGDLVIRNDFVDFVTAVSGPCLSALPFVPMDERAVAMLEGGGGLASREVFRLRDDARSWLAPWLLGLALVSAIAEMFVRRRKSQPMAVSGSHNARMASAA